MKKLFMSAVALLFAGALWAQENPLWMRHCAISPDGTTIAFTYKGDIFTVPVSGGKATQITTNPAFDTTPIWSPVSRLLLLPTAWEVWTYLLCRKTVESLAV